MSRWLLAAIVSSATVPCAALIVTGHGLVVDDREAARAALSDVVLDAPDAPDGMIEDYGPLVEAVRSRPGVAGANVVLSGPVLVEGGSLRATARLVGLPAGGERFEALGRLTTSGSIDALLDDDGAVALGEGLAHALEVAVGDRVRLVTLAPGPAALGARRGSFAVSALLRSGLTGFDQTAVLGRLDAVRPLLAPGSATTALETVLASPSGSERARSLAMPPERPELRARAFGDRDWPVRDGQAVLALGRSSLLLALLVCLVAFAAAPPSATKRRLGAHLRRAGPVAALGLAGALVVTAAATVAAGGGSGLGEHGWLDLGRLLGAVSLALLLAGALSGRLTARAAGVVLAGLVAVGTVQPAASAVLASRSRQAAVEAVRAAETAARLVSSAPLEALAVRGAEVARVRLLALEPGREDSARLLRTLTGGGEGIDLGSGSAARPLPWTPSGPPLDALLDALLEDLAGEVPAADPAGQPAATVEAPGLVLGGAVARRLGVVAGDHVTVVAAPDGLEAGGRVEPPAPVRFRVAGVGGFGLRALDDRLALADRWQVAGLGGSARGVPSGLAPPGAVERAAAPFEQRSGRAAAAASVQLCLACLLLGAFAAAGRRRGWGLIAWVVVGAGAGLVLGLNDAARGTVGVGDAILYEVAPRGRAGLREAVTAVALLPAATAVLFAAVGASLRARLVGPTGPTPPVPGAAP